MQTFTLPRQLDRAKAVPRIAAFLSSLSIDRAWVVEVRQMVRTRSQQQNRYLWGVCYPAILKHLPGWDADDIHDYCLGECFGWEVLEGFGKKRQRPIKRSAKLSTTEFVDYVADIQRRMAERGIWIGDPGESEDGTHAD
jgi:hypothetical protein